MNAYIASTFKTKVVRLALRNKSFKQQLLSGSITAKAAIEREIGLRIPKSLEVKVLEEQNDVFYLILPKMLSENKELSSKKINWTMWLEEVFYFMCVVR